MSCPSSNPWTYPLHMTPKSMATSASVVNNRTKNNATVPDRYSIPHIRDFPNSLWANSIFSKFDLVWAYYHISVAPEGVLKTFIAMKFGLYELLRITPGLRNAAQVFQKSMDQVLRGLIFAIRCIDEALIVTTGEHEHRENVLLVWNLYQYTYVHSWCFIYWIP